MIRLGLLGAHGRMGQWVCRLADSDYKTEVQLEPRIGRNSPSSALLGCDVVIDFSSPSAMHELAQTALSEWNANSQIKLPGFVIGSTGWDTVGMETLEILASKTPVLVASNFSIGVLVLREVLKDYSAVLQRFGFIPVILESHHKHKKDAPSGTAITLQSAISPEHPELVQTHSIRAGEIIGDHLVNFHAQGEKVSFHHSAEERSIFARGSIKAAFWIHSLRSGKGTIAKKSPSKNILSMEDFYLSQKGLSL